MKGIKLLATEVLFLLALLSLCIATNAPAQSTFGSITGTVTDQSGAVVPGANVTVTNEGTGVSRTVTCSSAGVYTVTDLGPGSYRVRVEATGFSAEERPGVVLYVHQVANVDVQLQVGAATTQVVVQGGAPVIATETSTVSQTKISEELLSLPLTIRTSNSNLGFAIYNPGVGVNDSGNFFANGVRQVDTYAATDGIVEMADPDGVGGGQIQPGVESVSDITYITGTPNAEYRSAVNFVNATKSGTNRYHGGLYWGYNSSDLNTRDFFSTSVPFRVFNDFAGSFGGPIKKNKLFFFAAWEGQYNRGEDIVTGNTPLPAWRTGDFSGLLPGTVVSDPTNINPATGIATPFTGNIIPSNRISTVSQNLENFFYPLPNYGPAGLVSGNWRGLFPTLNRYNLAPLDGRVDYTPTSKDSMFGRFTYRRLPFTAHENYLPPVGYRDQVRTSDMAVLSWTHTFGPTLLNEARAGFARNNNFFHPSLLGSSIISQMGIQGITTTGIYGVPVLNISGLKGTNQLAEADGLDTNVQIIDDLSWTHGSHSMKFGMDAIRDRIDSYGYNNAMYGSYNFTGAFSGYPFADFLLGLPQTTGIVLPTPKGYLRGTMWGFYAQDQWKVSPRLTVNYGLRWELQGTYYDKLGRISSFDPSLAAIVVPNNGLSEVNPLFPTNIPIVTVSKANYPGPALVVFPKTNFYPRFGAAYKLTSDGKMVVRAGYGIYGDTVYGLVAESSQGAVFAGSETFTNHISSTGVPLFSFPDPFLSAAGNIAPSENVSGFNPNMKTPYTQQWTITLERQIGTLGLSLGYVGSHSVNLMYPRNVDQPPPSTNVFSFANTPFPNLQSVTMFDNGAGERYNALSIAATKTHGKNMIFSTGYTWARDLTDQDDNDWLFGQTIQNQYNRSAEWGNNLFTPINRLYADFVYALPFGKSQRFASQMPKAADSALGGWRISGVVTLQSGQFLTAMFSGYDPSDTNNYTGRPDVVPGVSTVPPGGRTIAEWFNPVAFKIPGCPNSAPLCDPTDGGTVPEIGRFGNAGNDTLQTPAMKNLDLGLLKDFRFKERYKLQVQAMFSNVFNHPNFGYPDNFITDGPGVAGSITSTNSNFLQGSGTTRVITLALRLDF